MSEHRKLLLLVSALLLAIAAPALPQSAAGKDVLRVQLDGFRNDHGMAHCSLFNDKEPAAFPSHGEKMFREGAAAPIKNEHSEIDYIGIPPGKYALVCFHDENNNGKFDQDMLGLPKEGYCFSNNVKPRFSAPSFDQSAFDYKGGDQTISISMLY